MPILNKLAKILEDHSLKISAVAALVVIIATLSNPVRTLFTATTNALAQLLPKINQALSDPTIALSLAIIIFLNLYIILFFIARKILKRLIDSIANDIKNALGDELEKRLKIQLEEHLEVQLDKHLETKLKKHLPQTHVISGDPAPISGLYYSVLDGQKQVFKKGQATPRTPDTGGSLKDTLWIQIDILSQHGETTPRPNLETLILQQINRQEGYKKHITLRYNSLAPKYDSREVRQTMTNLIYKGLLTVDVSTKNSANVKITDKGLRYLRIP